MIHQLSCLLDDIGKGRYLSLCRHVQLLRYIYSGFLHPWLCLVSNAPEVRLSTLVSQDKSLKVRLPMSYDSYLDNNFVSYFDSSQKSQYHDPDKPRKPHPSTSRERGSGDFVYNDLC